MILPDVNVLLYAFRRDSVDHAKFREWLEKVVNGASTYGMCPQVLSSLIRISTNPRVYVQPSTAEEAINFCNALMDQPQCQRIQPGPRHWGIFERLCIETPVSGNLVADAWFAAIVIESGSEWVTTDGDYSRFRELNHRRPF